MDDLGLPPGWTLAPAQDDNMGLPDGWKVDPTAAGPAMAQPKNPPLPPAIDPADLTALRQPNPAPVPPTGRPVDPAALTAAMDAQSGRNGTAGTPPTSDGSGLDLSTPFQTRLADAYQRFSSGAASGMDLRNQFTPDEIANHPWLTSIMGAPGQLIGGFMGGVGGLAGGAARLAGADTNTADQADRTARGLLESQAPQEAGAGIPEATASSPAAIDSFLADAAKAKTRADAAAAPRALAPPPDQAAPPAAAPALPNAPETPPAAPGGAGASATPPAAPAATPAPAVDPTDGILKRAGYSDADIAKMSPEEKAAELEDARQNGITEPLPENAGTRTAPVKAQTAADVDAAANVVNTNPTPAQALAGNYQKAHVVVDGLPISIENPAGSTRSGTDPDGTPWQSTLPAHYGYIKNSEGADGDHVDVFIGPNPGNGKAFVVDQVDPKSRGFDEHKVVLGVDDISQAANLYNAAFGDGSGWARIGGITETTPDQIKAWVNGGKVGKPWAPILKADDLPPGWKPAAEAPATEQGAGLLTNPQPAKTSAAPVEAQPGLGNEGAYLSSGQTATAEPAPEAGFAQPQGGPLAPADTPAAEPPPGATTALKPRPTRAPAKPQSLLRFLRNAGGVKDEGGELTALGLNRYPGLINNRAGRSLDNARRLAAEAGYMGGDIEHAMANSTVADFLDHLSRGASGYSVHDEAAVGQKTDKEIADEDHDYFVNQHHAALKEDLLRAGLSEDDLDPAVMSLAAEMMHTEGVLMETAYSAALLRLEANNPTERAALEEALPDIPWSDYAHNPEHWSHSDEPWNEPWHKPESATAHGEGAAPGGDREGHPGADEARPYDTGSSEEGAGAPRGETVSHAPQAAQGSLATLKEAEEDIAAGRGNAGLLDEHRSPKAAAKFLEAHGWKPFQIGKMKSFMSPDGEGYGFLSTSVEGNSQQFQWSIFGSKYGPTKAEAEKAMAKAPTTEPGAEGKPQTVIPGTERIGQGEHAQMQADKPLRPKVPQKDVGGLFGEDHLQADLVDMAKAPKTEQQAIRDGELPVIDDRERVRLENVRKLEEAKAPAPEKWTKIGTNAAGNPVYEDENGVRSYVEGGIRVSESVGVKPGGGIETSREHGADYTPVEERPAVTLTLPNGKPKEAVHPAEKIAERLLNGPLTLKEAAAILGDEGKDKKALEEAVEVGVVTAAREIALHQHPQDPERAFDRLVQLYADQPALTARTSVSMRDQAYSTPAPLAYVAARLAGITDKTRVYEPTAGNGMLLITAPFGRTVANELNQDRAQALFLNFGFHVMRQDAADPATTRYAESVPFPGKNSIEGDRTPVPFDVVIANPPFGALRQSDGTSKNFDLSGVAGAPGYTTNEIDHAIAFRALEGLKKDGRAVLILGGVSKLAKSPEERAKGYQGKAKRNFFAALYGKYNVVDHFTVAGELYEKQGAGWPVDIVVIDGRGQSALPLPRNAPPPVLSTWDEVGGKLNGLGYSSTTGEPAGAASAQPAGGRAPGSDAADRPVDDGRASADVGEPVAQPEPARVRTGHDSEQRPARPEPGGRAPGHGGGEPGRPDLAAPAPGLSPSVKRQPIQQDKETETQVAYKPAATTARGLGTLLPANQRSAVASALARVDKEVGGVDAFVAREIGMPLADLPAAFSAEQVDAIALAIHNIQKGDALIVGDQTGVGKGRIVAGLIMYALRKGFVPVFVTEKPNLYADIYRDLEDIGAEKHIGHPLRLLMTNSGANDKVPLDEEGTKLLQPEPNHNALLADIANGSKVLEHDVVLTTYNQMQTVKGAETVRRPFLRSLAPNALMLFDEAHNAGSLPERKIIKKDKNGKPIPSAPDRAEFVRELGQLAKGVYYSSATYAKRPDSMDFYARTDMRKAVEDIKKLGEAIAQGGVPLQTVNSAMLAQAGQYLRRERTFDGIKYGIEITPIDRKAYRDFAAALRAVQQFSAAVKEATKNLDLEGTDIVSHDGATGEAGAQSTNFTSVMHNLIGQYLLASKADDAAMRAVAAIRAGQRPVIALANTNESFLAEFMAENELKIGDAIDLDFRGLLGRYLERSREVIIKEGYAGKGTRKRLDDSELGPVGRMLYKAARRAIEGGSFEALPISPIDRMRQIIQDAGHTVGEITGRQKIINYHAEGARLAGRPTSETSVRGRRKAISDFNAARLEALIINAAGSTGLSIHDDPRFPKSGHGQRHMILAQANGDINTHMQTLGRVNRTGQQTKPEYTQLGASVAAEVRPMAILAKKMASLNANTTSAKGSALTAKDTPDFMNKYGDKVAAQLLYDEPEIARILDVEPGTPDKPDEDLMRKVTGRIALLDPDDQDRVMDLLQDGYHRLIDYLDGIGENTLEAKTLDLDAKLLSETILTDAKGTSPFEQASVMGTYDVKSTAKPVPFADVVREVASAVGMPDESDFAALRRRGEQVMADRVDTVLKSFDTFRKEALKGIEEKVAKAGQDTDESAAAMQRFAAETTRFNGIRNDFESLAKVLAPGAKVTLTDPESAERWTGVVIDTTRNGKTKNPLALSSWSAEIAAPGFGIQRLPLSQLAVPNEGAPDTKMKVEPAPDWITTDQQLAETFDQTAKERREHRLIVTGNLLAGFAAVPGKKTIIHFTDHDGQTKQGILLPASAKASEVLREQSKPLPTAEAVVDYVKEEEGNSVHSADGVIRIVYQRPPRQRWQSPEVSIQIKPAKAEGGKYFLNPDVMSAANFSKEAGFMTWRSANVARAIPTINALIKAGARFTRPLTDVEKAQAVLDNAKKVAEAKKASPAASMRPVLANRMSDAQFAMVRDGVAEILKRMVGPSFQGAYIGERPPSWMQITPEAAVASGARPEDAASVPLGMMDPATGMIFVAAGTGHERVVAYHEGQHFLQAYGYYTPAEQELIAQQMPRMRERVREVYGLTSDELAKMPDYEISAYYIGYYLAKKDSAAMRGEHIGLRRLVDRTRNLYDRVRAFLAGYGLRSIHDIFDAVHAGTVGRRGPDQGPRESFNPAAALRRAYGLDEVYSDKPVIPRIVEKAKAAFDTGRMVENWQDIHAPVRTMQNEFAARAGRTSLPDNLNPYLAKRLLPGKVLAVTKNADARFYEPIVDIMKRAGLSMQDVGLFLLARHAPERNALMDQRDPNMNGAGSGITDDEAAGILGRLQAEGKMGALQNVGRIVDDMREFTLRTMVSSGLMSKAVADELRDQFEHYVPLQGFEDERFAPDDAYYGEARKLGPKGKEFHVAFGRRSISDNPLTNALHQMYRAIDRAERNKAAKHVYRLMRSLPKDDIADLARIDEGEQVKVLDKNTGLMVWRERQPRPADPATLIVKLGGVSHYVTFLDRRTGEAVNRITSESTGPFVRTILNLYAHIKAAWTHLSLPFLIRHFTQRYPLELLGNQGEHGAGAAFKAAAAGYPLLGTASRAVFKAMRMGPSEVAALRQKVGRGQASNQEKWIGYFHEMKEAGGLINFTAYSDLDRIKHHLAEDIATFKGDPLRAAKAQGRRFFEAWDSVTNALDTAQRLAVYRQARERGESVSQAALAAREATVDFNLRGRLSPALGIMRAFGNVAVQTTARAVKAIRRNPKAMAKVLASFMLAGSATTLWNYEVGGHAKDGTAYIEQLPDYAREKSVILMLPGTHDAKGRPYYVNFAMPYFFNLPYQSGVAMTQLALKATGEAREPVEKIAQSVFRVALEALTPFGNEAHPLAWITPQPLLPEVHVATNTAWYGGPVHTTFPREGLAHAEQGRRSTSEFWKGTARAVNRATGGDRYHRGAIDMFPEDYREMFGFVTSAWTRSMSDVGEAATAAERGEAPEIASLPVISSFIGGGSVYDRKIQADYYEAKKKAEASFAALSKARKDGNRAEAEKIVRTERDELRAHQIFKATDKRLRALYGALDSLDKNTAMSGAQKEARQRQLEKQIIETMEQAHHLAR